MRSAGCWSSIAWFIERASVFTCPRSFWSAAVSYVARWHSGTRWRKKLVGLWLLLRRLCRAPIVPQLLTFIALVLHTRVWRRGADVGAIAKVCHATPGNFWLKPLKLPSSFAVRGAPQSALSVHCSRHSCPPALWSAQSVQQHFKCLGRKEPASIILIFCIQNEKGGATRLPLLYQTKKSLTRVQQVRRL